MRYPQMVYDKWFMREYPTKKMDLLGGLVAINFIFPYIGLLSSSQLTKSIIFQDGVALAHQGWLGGTPIF